MARLRRMKIFVTLVESGQFTRAAQQLSISKSTVSQAISDLEAYLGLQLIKRNGRSFQLTEAGQLYYEEALKVLADISDLEDRVRGTSLGMSGQIRITAPDTYGTNVVTPLIVKFMNLYPDVSIEIILTERQTDLVAEGIDLAFRIGPMKDSGLLARKIGSTYLMLCAAPSYLEKYGVPEQLSDLKEHSCLVYSRSPSWVLEEEGRVESFRPKGRVKTTNGENLRDFAVAGLGIACMPELIASDALKRGELVHVMEDIKGANLDIHIVRSPDRHSPARIRGFVDFVLSELGS